MQRYHRLVPSLVPILIVVLSSGAPPAAEALTAARAGVPAPALALLHLRVTPATLSLGRDVALHLSVTDERGRPIDNAVLSISGLSRPALGGTHAGALSLVIHADRLSVARVEASHAGYAPAWLNLPIVPGSPATILAYKSGVGVLRPGHKIERGAAGMDLFAAYQALTTKSELATLGLRDGTLVYMNRDTDVQIFDPLHQRLSAGEIFMEVVHGSASHQVQVGAAAAGTQGTQLDVAFNPRTRVARVAVAQGRVRGRRGTVYVAAGQQTTIPPSGRPMRPKAVNLAALLAWLQYSPHGAGSVTTPVLVLPPPPVTNITPPAPAPKPARTETGTLATTTWTRARGPYLVQGTLQVPAGHTLTIQPGAIVEMDSGALLILKGVLIARGTAAAPIVFTSSQAQPRAGDWGGLLFAGPTSSASLLAYTQVFYAGEPAILPGNWGSVEVINGAAPAFSKCAIGRAGGVGLYADRASLPAVSGCVFAGDNGPAISLPARDPSRVHDNAFAQGQQGLQIRR